MADYAVVPYSSGSQPYEHYLQGALYCSYSQSYFHVATLLDIDMIVGGYLHNNSVITVFVSSVNQFKISPTAFNQNTQSYFDYSQTEISSGTSYRSKYYYEMPGSGMITIQEYTWEFTIFRSKEECLNALIGYDNPGVHVIFSPVYVPSFPGVHVQFNPVLSDSNAQGGTSVPGGGDGTFDETSDAIPVPSLPSISTVDTGLVTLFRPTREEVAALGSYLWTNFTDFIENLQKLFTNPMDYFIAFNIFPVSPLVTNARNIYIGNWGTDISMPPVANQWYEFDCGTVMLQKYWGSALDYAPNTKVQLMLPYIGSVQLNTDEVMGNQIGVKYRIDLLSGSCVAMVTVNGNVYYQFTGECAVAIPLTGADWSRVYSAVIGAVGTAIAGGVGVAAAGMGITSGGMIAAKSYESAAAAGASYAAINETSKGVKGVAEMRQTMIEAARASMENAKGAASKSYHKARGVESMRLANTINNTVGQVMGAKSGVSHSGTVSGSAGMLGVRDAYLIVEYPNQSLAKDYKHFVGYPSNMYARLGTLSGYTEVEQVIPEGIWGTDDELAELIDALKGGVYL